MGYLLVWQRWRCLASEDGSSSRGIDFLDALFLGSFVGSGGSLISLYAGYVVGIVNIPRLVQSVGCYALCNGEEVPSCQADGWISVSAEVP